MTLNHQSFSSFVDVMTEFYSVMSRCQAWSRDIAWLNGDWVHLSARRVATLESDTHGQPLDLLAKFVADKYSKVGLRSRFVLHSTNFSIVFSEIVGYVARDCLLNDSVIMFMLQHMCDEVEGLVLNSFVPEVGWPDPPRRPISSCPFVVLPVHFDHPDHWGMILVQFDYSSNVIQAIFYEPTMN